MNGSFNKRILFVLTSLIFLGGAIFVYSSLIQPAYSDAQQMRNELYTKQQMIAKYTQSVQGLQTILSKFQGQGNVQDTISRILPSKQDPSYVTTQLIGFAKLNNLQVQSLALSPQPSIAIGNATGTIRGVGVLQADMQTVGGYSNFKKFLSQIESNLLILDVNNLTMTLQKTTTANVLQETFSIKSYYQL